MTKLLAIFTVTLMMLTHSNLAFAAGSAEVACVQQGLYDAGLNPKGIDGNVGPGTRKAAAAYLEKNTDAILQKLTNETASSWCSHLGAVVLSVDLVNISRKQQRANKDVGFAASVDIGWDYQVIQKRRYLPKNLKEFIWLSRGDSSKLYRTAVFSGLLEAALVSSENKTISGELVEICFRMNVEAFSSCIKKGEDTNGVYYLEHKAKGKY